MRKILIAMLMALVMVSGVIAWSVPIPGNGYTVGNTTTPFQINSDLGNCVNSGFLYVAPNLIPITSCNLGIYSIQQDLSLNIEGTTFPHSFFVNSLGFSPNYAPTIDRTSPAAPGAFVASVGTGDLDIDLSFNAVTDLSGIDHYNIYEDINPVPIATIPGTYVTGTIVTVQASIAGSHDFYVAAVDKASNPEGPRAGPQTVIATEAPPALDTSLFADGVDESDCVIPDGICHLIVYYTKAVTLGIESGGYVQTLSPAAAVLDWYPPIDPASLAAYKYNFKFTANRLGFAPVLNDYILGSGAAASVTVGGNMNTVSFVGLPYPVKGNAINNGMDWVVLGFDYTTTGNPDVSIQLGDFINSAGPDGILGNADDVDVAAIDLLTYNGDGLYDDTAIAFCSDGYNPATQTYDATLDALDGTTTGTISVENGVTGLVIDCSSTGSVYILVNVPLNAPLGGASTTINFMN